MPLATPLSTPELLAPAGTLKNMRYAFAYGADAVYAGQPRYSLRVRNNEFDHANLALGIKEAQAQGKRFYVVVNIAPHNAKLKTFLKDLSPVIAMAPDALIMSDPGLIMLVRRHFPQMPIHLSVQANTVNWASVEFWQQQGLSRIILSRELSLEEIAEIRQQVPAMELEVFVHGALCMAYSGRCLLSGYMNKRDANQAVAPMPVAGSTRRRRPRKISSARLFSSVSLNRPWASARDRSGVPVAGSQSTGRVDAGLRGRTRHLHHERQRPARRAACRAFDADGRAFTEDRGRTKSHFYCARTTQVYRQAIDDAVAGRAFDRNLMTALESLAQRGYTEGFLRRHVHDEYQNYRNGSSVSERQQFVGELTGERHDRLAEVKVKNRFSLGDHLELMTPKGNFHFDLHQLQNIKGEPIEVAPGDGHTVYVPIPDAVDLRFGLLMRDISAT